MKTLLTFLSSIVFLFNYGQISFSEILGPNVTTDFEDINTGASDYADVDNDGDIDILITGNNLTKLHLNDGNGNFSISPNSNFIGASFSTVKFADIDNDNDQDFLIIGQTSSQKMTRLYLNNGTGNYSETSPFENLANGDITIGDIDNDNDLDVLISGINNSNQKKCNLYINDGFGSFSLSTGTPFIGVEYSASTFGDIDGDGDLDILVTGLTSSTLKSTNIYINNGSSFVLQTSTNLPNISSGSVSLADIDGDSDLDLLLSGVNDSNSPLTNLFINDGTGQFSITPSPQIPDLIESYTVFTDIDNDTDLDLIISGFIYGNTQDMYTMEMLYNDGSGTFSNSNQDFLGLELGAISVFDIENDSDLDIFAAGSSASFNPTQNLYINNNGDFINSNGSYFTEVSGSSIRFLDIDNDADNDVLITGVRQGNPISQIYTNNGTGAFSASTLSNLTDVQYGTALSSDTDNDGDIDIFLTGLDYNETTAKLYSNNGIGLFTEVPGTPFTGLFHGDGIFIDVNNDNNQDLIITGLDSINTPSTHLYLNNGSNNFSLTMSNIEALSYSSISYADVDNDNDLDVFIIGENSSNTLKSSLYLNDGLGNFTLSTLNNFVGIKEGTIDFSDIDGNNTPDLLINGKDVNANLITNLYINDGNGLFTLVQNTPFESTNNGNAKFIDIDGDSDNDIIINGLNAASEKTINLYINDGTGLYTVVPNLLLPPTYFGDLQISDIDNDGKLDFIISGIDTTFTQAIHLFKNNSCLASYYTDTIISCSPITWIDGTTYSASNNTATFSYLGGSNNGCDSIVSLNFTLFNSPNDTDVVITCDSLNWIDGNTYFASNNSATHILSGGCTITLDLTILGNSSGIDTQTTCDSIIWIDGITYSSNNTTATHTIPNGSAQGCDSTVTLNLTILNTPTGVDTQTTCDSLVWIDGNTYLANNSTAIHTIINGAISGCDSIVTLNLTILNSTSSIDHQTSCSFNYTWIDGNTYSPLNDSATYIIPGGATNGCDSIITLDLSYVLASFSYTNDNAGTITFTNNSFGNNLDYDWNFGNGDTSSILNPTTTYPANGIYTVVLAVSDSSGCISYASQNIIIAGVTTPTNCNAAFVTFIDTAYFPGVIVVNNSTGNIIDFLWEFGDGNSSTDEFPSYSYSTSGPFNLCLTVSDGINCTDIFCDSIGEDGVILKSGGFDISVVPPSALGTNPILSSDLIKIYPNPATNVIYLESKLLKINTIEIVDITGKTILFKNENMNNIDISQLSEGMYIIRITDKNNSLITKSFYKIKP